MNKKTASFFRVDEQVFFTMGGLCVVAIIIMAFRIGASTPCMPVNIEVDNSTLVENRIIGFKAKPATGKTFAWNFGDGTILNDEAMGITSHVYKKSGTYTVSLVVNGNCSEMIKIRIAEAIDNTAKNLMPIIKAPDTAYLNEPVNFADLNMAATEWEWKFGETGDVDSRVSTPTFTFRFVGSKKVRLKVNNREDLVQYKEVLVLDRDAIKREAIKAGQPGRVKIGPPSLPNNPIVAPIQALVEDHVVNEPKPTPKAPTITELQLEAMLNEVAAGTRKTEDFSIYLGGQLNISVSYNKMVISFSAACDELKKTGKRKIKSITVSSKEVDPETNRVISMKIKVEKKFLRL